MDIVKAFSDSLNIFMKNFLVILLATLVAILISFVTLGILAVPMHVGIQMLFVKAKRGEPVQFNDIFAPISRFFALFFGSIWMAILICIGIVLLVVPGLCWASWWMYGLLFIVDKGKGIGEAMRLSKDIVRKNNLWMHLLLILLAGIVSQIGMYVFRVGALITIPLALGAVACAYVDETK